MRRKELWKKRLYKASAIIMALSMLFGSPMMALAEGNGSANSDLSALESASADLENEAKENATGVQQAVAEEQAKELVNPDNNPSYDPSASPSYDPSPSWAPEDEPSFEPSWEPSEEPSIVPEVENETTVETEVDEDGVVIGRDTTITRKATWYATDEDEKGDFEWVNKEDVEGQTLEYADDSKIVEVETHYYVADENGEILTVTDEYGNESKLEIEEGALEEAEEVWVGQDEDGKEIEVDTDTVVYGYIDENGNLLALPEGTEGGQFYAASKDGMVVATRWYTMINADGEEITVDPEIMKALRGEESEYTVGRAYYLDGQEYTAQELADVLPEDAQLGDWDYDLDSNVFVEGTEITFPAGTKVSAIGRTMTQFVYNGYVYNTRTTIPTRTSASGYGFEFAEDVVIKASDLLIIGEARYTDKEGEKNFTATENQKNVIVTVYDKDGNVVWTGNKATYDKIQEHAVSVVAGKIAVEDVYGETIYLDRATYKEVRESTTYVYETRDEYYTPHDKYTSEELTTTFNGQEYKLTLNFWDNNRIGLGVAALYPNAEGTYMILGITFDYAAYQSCLGKTIAYYDTVYKALYPSDFGPTGEAVLTVKYTPEYERTNEVTSMVRASFDDSDEEDFFLDGSEGEDIICDWDRYENDEEYRKLIDAWEESMEETLVRFDEWPHYEVDLDELLQSESGDGSYEYSMELGKPYAKLEKVGEVTPNPNPNPSPAPSGNTPVATTVSNAAVLGESREQVVEETPEESAVLGEDRPQTGDMAMPFAWLLTMIGCGAASVIALRKKER